MRGRSPRAAVVAAAPVWQSQRLLRELRCPNPEKMMFLATRHSYVPLYSAAFGFKGPAHFLFVANGAADEAEKAVVGSECIIAPFGIRAQVNRVG
jgi:hypothetical protein